MKKIQVFILFAFVSLITNAQTLPSKVEVFMPQILQQQTVTETEVQKLVADTYWGQKKPVKNKRYWTVYSDRD